MFDLFTSPPKPLPKRPDEPSLYERLGGIFAISAVINHFSDSILDDPIAGRNTRNDRLREWYEDHLDRLPGLKFMRTLWVASIAGGPYEFVPTVPEKCPFDLTNAHKRFEMTSEEFDAVALVLVRSLDHFGVPKREKDEVLAVFALHKRDIVDRDDRGHC